MSVNLIVFRLAQDLEHRVTDVEGKVARTAFAGESPLQPVVRALRHETDCLENGSQDPLRQDGA